MWVGNSDRMEFKKVAFVATVYRHLEAFHIPYMKLLLDKGIEVHAYAAATDSAKSAILDLGVKCHDVPFKRNPINLSNLGALLLLIKSFKENRLDMVHVHTPVAGIIARLAAKITRVQNVLYTAHGFHFFKGAPLFYWLLYYPAERIMARWTDYILTINREDYERASKFSVRKGVIYIPGVGLNTSLFDFENKDEIKKKVREEIGISCDDFVVLCVAELNKNKNQIQLIKAIEQIVKQRDSIKCLLVGIGEDETKLKYEIRQRGLERYIKLLGYRKDIPQLMASSDVVTLLSKREGLPKALMEAMACGKPILTTDVRGNHDLLINNVTGYIVPVNDVDRTLSAILSLYNNLELRNQMGKRNKELVQNYDLSKVFLQIEKLYKTILGYD